MPESQPNPQNESDSTFVNVERLLSRMSSADQPADEFVTRVQRELCQEAKRLAQSRTVKLASSRPFRWGVVLQTATAISAVFLLGFWWGLQQPTPAVRPVTLLPVTEPDSNRMVHSAKQHTDPVSMQIAFDRQLTTVGPENAVCLSYDDLVYQPRPDATTPAVEKLQPLFGHRIRIRGFMRPSFEESDLTGFWLARDNQFCCFGPNPKMCDIIRVTLRDGSTTNYIEGRPFDVVGILEIDPASADETPDLLTLNDAIVVSR